MHDCSNAEVASVEAEIRLIERMTLAELRHFWTARWGFAPIFRSVDLLRHLIAWRLQVAEFGGLDEDTRRRLQLTRIPHAQGPPPGSRLVREYLGVLCHVDVREDGFSYLGTTYRSLSAVAFAITGTRWNGPRFFGLRNTERAR